MPRIAIGGAVPVAPSRTSGVVAVVAATPEDIVEIYLAP